MVDLPGYQITERIKIGINTVIYRGVRQQDGQSVFLKILAKEYPTLEELTRLKHEYEITHNLDIAGIVKPLALKKHQNRLALILEDFGGESLQKFIANKKIGLEEFLKIAIQLATTLGSLHKNQIIHKDIKPANIIIHPSTREVKITDFSISSRLSRENQTIRNPNLLEGTLAYMSPEQTGRMNRSIDYRTDLYSLGVTFYEILTGKLPHQATDPMELVYCHIAKTPVSPKQLNPEIPQAVSDIVMKLLSKTAEDRYQSGLGLKADLETCLTQLLATGKIDNFILGQQDLSGKLLIPQKLYGREAEVATLMDAFERVSGGTKEMMLVSGYSGIGKSCLVNELHKPILRQRGYFISGKFDQFKRNIPYSSLIQAFQELMRQLLTESEENIAAWNSKLLAAFGPNGQIIIDVIPEVELIVGKQPSVSQLDGSESQNRFNLVFKQFIGVFTQKEHPLVLFLDDLQWADSASLKLIHLLMSDPDSQYLLLIGAYRDNEVGATHPLMLTLEEIENTGAIVNAIALKPLGLDTINQLVAETLSCDKEQSQPLAELLLDKTAGNPFFLTQLLKSLYQENLLAYNPPYLHPPYQGGDRGGQGGSKGGWQWDISLLHRMGITDNVVELMVGKIQKLDDNTQNVLKLAACIGNRFDLDVLTIVNEKSLKATAAELWPALQSGLILTRSDAYKIPLVIDESSLVNCQGQRTNDSGQMTITYKFLHDRVQQAAYALIPQSHKKEVHLKVGQLLLQNTYPEEREEKIFEIVNHLNLGKELITDRSQRDELAQLNLIAGQKAKAATAYEPAIRYLTVGLKLLAEDSWTRQYDLTLALYVETVEAEFLNTNFERSETLGEVVLQNATKLLDQVKVYELKIQIYAAQLMMPLAVDTGLQVLEMLGYPVSSNSRDERGLVKLPGMADLEDMPEMTDPYQLAAMRILMNITVPAQNSRPDIFPQVMLTMVNLCIEYGHSKLAAFAYSWYGLLLCGAHGDIDGGYYSGQLALMLLEQFQANSLKAKVLVLFNAHVRYWKDHAREGIAPLLEGVKSGLETGDIEYASYCALHYCVLMFFVGEPLETVEQSSAPYIDILQKYKQEIAIYYNNVWIQLRLNLVGRAADKYRLIGSSFDEEAMLPRFHEAKNGTLLFITYSAKGILLYLFKEYAAAVENASRAAEYKECANGTMAGALHNFYYSLALLGHYPNVATNEQQQILRLVAANQEKMQQWAYHAQGNFQHKYDLVEAEKARVLGQIGGAIACYDRAIKGARVQGYIQEEALAYEKAAEFYIALGGEEIAQTYMTKAYYGYVRWGANAKVKDLETRYPNFTTIPFTNTERLQVTSVTTSTTGGDAGVLDFATVMKASQAIAGEIVLGSLLDKLMRIVIENAGAQTGLLILEKDGKMQIEATGAVDKDEVVVCQSTPIEIPKMPMSVINYVKRTKENVVLNDATRERFFDKDPYMIANKPKSVLCTPIINKGKLIGILYFENNLTTGAFTPNRLEVFKILSSQVAISIENALLYTELSKANECLKQANEQLEEYSRTLEQKVQDRTLELKEKNRRLREQATQLKQALQELQQTQSQLIQTEKMSSLGQMVAGVAHEINNPISFIYGNIIHASKYIEDLLSLLNLYQQEYPNPTPAIQHEIEAIELEFLNEDLPKLLSSMQVGAERIRQIVLSLRNFSRLDEAEMKPVDIHEGIDSTLLILQNRLKANAGNPGIQVIKEYGNLPPVECFAGQLNQVFMNLIANAIDVLEECNKARSHLPTIRIRTQVLDQERVAISIADNGPGMTEEVRDRIFDPFFTTKPVGKGTGLGLSISYQIVVEKHGGQLKCNSTPGQGAEFIIEIPIRQ